MLAWKACKYSHENHGILLQLHAPRYSRESIDFSHEFFITGMVFPWISHAFSTRVEGTLGAKEAILFDRYIAKEVTLYRRNLTVAWTDVKKAYDS